MTRRDRISLALCATAVVVSVVALGGATRWSQAIVAAIVAVAVSVTVWSKRRLAHWSPLLLLLAAASTWTLVQVIPLPAALVHALNPELAALRDEGAALAGVAPSSTLSIDPAATLRSLTFLATLSGIAIVALRLSVSERGRYLLLASVAGTAGVAALLAAAHEVAGATALYGLYEPRQLPPILGPLLNPNHLGGLTAVGVLTSIGLMLYAKQSALLRVFWVVTAIGCLAITTATFSRGAIVGLGAGVLVMLATLIVQRLYAIELAASRQRREHFFATTLPIGLTVVCALFVTVYLGAGTVMEQLETTSLDELQAPRTKYAAWISTAELVRESPWVGIGRGAFESAFTRVHAASAYSTFSHPENVIVQTVAEWGIPAALGFALLAGWTLLIAVRRWRDGPLAAGALGALMAVAFQSNFDFGVELLGLAVPMTVVISILTYAPLAEIASHTIRRYQAGRSGHVALVLGGAILLLMPATRMIADDHDTLRSEPSRTAVLESIEAHPLDYFSYAVLAEQLFRAGEPSAIATLNHALRLHPTHAELHWIAARLLVRTNRLSQAEAEYTTAVRYSRDPKPVLAEIVKTLPPERAARTIPLDMSIENTLRYIRLDIAAMWLERILEHGNNIHAAEMLYSHGMRAKDWPMAERGARYRCRIMPSTKCTLELAKVLERQGSPQRVIDTLSDVAKWQGRREDQVAAWRMLCGAYKAQNKLDEAADCLRRLDASGPLQVEQ